MIFKKYQNFWVFFIFLVLAFGFFGITLNNFFVSDDFDFLFIAKNTKNVFSYFLTNYWGERSGGAYAPLLNLLFYFEYKIWNLNPLGYHLTNLIFHLGASFFVFLIGLELFKKRTPAFLAGFLFLIFPAHTEAVNWIAARPHVIGAFFYLVCVWSYLKFRKDGKLKFILVALVAFIFSLLTKELALTLPIVILAFEIVNLKFKEYSALKIWQWPIIFFVVTAIYALVRYFATDVLFGYYAGNFILKAAQIFKTFTSGLLGLVFWGSTRIYLTELFFDYKILFLILVFLIIVFFGLRLRRGRVPRFYEDGGANFLISLILFVVPFTLIILFLQFNPTSDEGERYLYLPSAGFCLLLVFFLNIFKNKIWFAVFSLIIAFYFSFFLINKNLIWCDASRISKKIIYDFGKVVDAKMQSAGLVFFSLPDTYEGAHIFRNGIKQAVALYYPDYQSDPVIFLPIYLRLNKFNQNDKIINWLGGKERNYIFGVSQKGGYEITGFDRKETEDFIFELWGYNYSNHTSNAVKLKIKERIKELIKDKKIFFLVYDKGELKKLEWF